MRAPLADGYDGPFWFEQYDRTPRVFFGHTALEEPIVGDGAIGLDTGCVYGGALTAYDCNADEFVSLSPDETYQERPAARSVAGTTRTPPTTSPRRRSTSTRRPSTSRRSGTSRRTPTR